MTRMLTCSEGGYLVGPDHVVPEDPAERAWQGAGVVVGCNRLACERCGKAVVQRPGFDATRRLKPRLAEVYAAASWQRWVEEGVLEADERVRLYVCACASHGERMVSPVVEDPEGRPGGPQIWRCGGHPAAGAQAAVAAKAPSAGEAAAFVEAALGGEDGGPEAIDRRYHLTGDDALREAIGAAALAQVTASDARRRMRALGFFSRNPGVPEAAELAKLYARHRELFDDVADPFGHRPSVAAFLFEILADRVDPRDGFADATAAREVLRAALLAGAPVPDRALAALASADQAWLSEHATAAIAAAAPAAATERAGAIVHALRYLPEAELAELLVRAAAAPGVDRAELGQLLVEAIGGHTALLVRRTLGLPG